MEFNHGGLVVNPHAMADNAQKYLHTCIYDMHEYKINSLNIPDKNSVCRSVIAEKMSSWMKI